MTESGATEEEQIICEFNSSEEPPWVSLFAQKYTNYKGLVHTLADAKEILRRLEVSTCTKYAVWNTNKKNFGLTEFSPYARPFRIFWGPDLVPYVMLNRKVLDCQHGRDRKVAWKQRQRTMKMISDEDGKPIVKRRKKDPNLRSQSIIQDGTVVQLCNWTKKYDCPAQVIFQEILRFPEYKLIKNTKWTEIKTVRLLRQELKAMKDITCIRGFIVTVPENSHHQNHTIGLGVVMWQVIDAQLIAWIQAMVSEGLTSVVKIRKNLRHLVKESYPNIDTNNSNFYPSVKTTAYYVHLARMRLLGTKDDPKHLEPQKGRFKKEKDEDLCDYFLLPARKSLTSCEEREVISEVAEVMQDFEDIPDHHDVDDAHLAVPIPGPVVLAPPLQQTKPLETLTEEFRDLLLQMQSYSFSVKNLPAMQKAYAEVEQAFANLKSACKKDRKIAVTNVSRGPNYQKRRVERIEVKCEKVVDLKPPTIKQVTFPSKRRKRDIELHTNATLEKDELSGLHEVSAVKLELTDDGSVLNITEYL